ncbi:MAG: TonB family protein [Acidobacteria bacterium]|nr:TonB family protein [Acidobacteriota bacterium]
MSGFLLAMAWKAAAIFGLAWAASMVMRRATAASRHMMWTAAAVAVLLAPVLSVSVPAWEVALPAGVTFSMTAQGTDVPAEAPAGGAVRTAGAAAPRWSVDWGSLGVWLWVTGVGVMLLKVGAAWQAVRRLQGEARRVEGVELGVEVLECGVEMPMSVGLRRPAILLPRGAPDWEAERLRLVLAHELAHVRRGDLVTNFIARMALCLHWWNPLAWVAWREFVREREKAADDMVLESGASAVAYAGYLLEMARAAAAEPELEPAALPMAKKSQLEGRLMSILDEKVKRGAPGRAARVGTVVVALAGVSILGAVRPSVVERTVPSVVQSVAQAVEPRAAEAQKAGMPGGMDYGTGLQKLAERELLAGHLAEAEKLYEQALTVYGADARAQAVKVKLGMLAIGRKEYAKAEAYLEKAQEGDVKVTAQALMWIGVSLERQGNLADAELLYRGGVGLSTLSDVQGQVAARLLARALKANGKELEAEDLERRLAEEVAAQRPELLPEPPEVHRIGGEVQSPVPVFKVEPGYTEEARVAGYMGQVLLAVVIGKDGKPFNVQVLRGIGLGLDEMAMDAVKQWKFKPGTKGGEAVNVRANIEVNFRLK